MDIHDAYAKRAQISCLYVYDLVSQKSTLLKKFPYVIEAPMWTKDGKSLLYNSEGLIYSYDMGSGESCIVDTGEVRFCNNDHVLSPDGSSIAVSGNTDGSGISKIYTVKLGSGVAVEVIGIPLSYLHGWSPDGNTLAYCAGRQIGDNLEWDVFICPAEGGAETRLTDAPGLDDGPEYASDGKTIWFNSVRTGRMQVWRMNADGSQQEQMTFDLDKNSWFPHISPDGKKVVYLAYGAEDLAPGDHLPDLNVELRMIPASGGAPQVLVRLFGGQGTINVNSWHPDSQSFAYVSYEKEIS